MSTAVKHRVLPKQAKTLRADLRRMRRSIRAGDWLGRGDRGKEVEALQRALKNADVYAGPSSGVFDRATERAVRRFQRQRDLTIDGVVGPQTLGALRSNNIFLEDRFEQPAHKGQSGRDVLAAERRLTALGYRCGSTDGVFDADTARAVRAFRADHPELRDNSSKLDQEVWKRLQQAYQSQVAPGADLRGKTVLHTERQLRRLGYDVGKVDARFTAATAAAVARFQRRQGLEVSGQVDRLTLLKLNRAVAKAKPRAERTMGRFERQAPKHNYAVHYFRGVRVNGRTREMLKRAEFVMRHAYGHKGFTFGLTQGSYNAGGVTASAGTHDGGGALDIRTRDHSKKTVDHMVKALRQAGFAAWSRGRGHDRFAPHIHAIAIGDRQLSSSARSQLREYAAGGDGLVGSAADPDRGLGRPIPAWAKRYL